VCISISNEQALVHKDLVLLQVSCTYGNSLVADAQTLKRLQDLMALEQQLHKTQMQVHEKQAEARVLHAQLLHSEKLCQAAATAGVGSEARCRQAEIERHHAQQLQQMQLLLQVWTE
jgi:hypothetical protein